MMVVSSLPFFSFLSTAPTIPITASTMEYSANTINSSLLSSGGKQYFPNSTIVMDMVLISHAVYKLKNRVSSCTDARARDVNVIQSFLQEESNLTNYDYYYRSHYLNNNDNNDEESKDLYQLLLPPGVTCLYYSHDTYLGTQVLVVRSVQHHYITVAYAGTDDWRTALMDGNIMMSNIGPTSDTSSSSSGSGSSTNKTSDNTTNNNKSTNENDNSGGRQHHQQKQKKKEQLQSLFNTIPNEIYVHRGFNEAVFDASHLNSVLQCVEVAILGGDCANIDNTDDDNDTDLTTTTLSVGKGEDGDNNQLWNNWWPWGHTAPSPPPPISPSTTPVAPYELYTTGHSLGAANSVLLGLALHMLYPTDNIRSINYGCPKIGNIHWSYYINSLQPDQPTNLNKPHGGTYEVFRFVNKIDLVPRLPELGVAMNPILSHTGHTLQMSVGGSIRAYYDHYGNEDDGYLGVPFGWEAASYALMPLAIASHPCSHYVEYLNDYKPSNSTSSSTNDDDDSLYYVNEFELMDGYVAPPKLLIDNNSSMDDGGTIIISKTQR